MLTKIYCATLVLLIFKLKKPTKSRHHRQNVEPEQLEDFNNALVRLTLLYDSLAILVHRKKQIPAKMSNYSSVYLVAEDVLKVDSWVMMVNHAVILTICKTLILSNSKNIQLVKITV